MNSKLTIVAVALVAVASCKSNSEPNAPALQATAKPVTTATTPAAAPARAPSMEATRDGIWGIRASEPLTLAELKQRLPDAELGELLVARQGVGRKSVSVERGEVSVTFFFRTATAPFVWFELAGEQRICIDGACLGGALEGAATLAGPTCVANHDGQGFSATFSCGARGASFLTQAALPDDTRQDHPLGQTEKPFPIQELVAAHATVAAFVWVAPSQKWKPPTYDEGDR
jgi:hypothetical protein